MHLQGFTRPPSLLGLNTFLSLSKYHLILFTTKHYNFIEISYTSKTTATTVTAAV